MTMIAKSHANNPYLCLTPSDLKALGKDQVAYVKKYRVKNHIAFVLHAADGTAIAVQKNAAAAHLSAQHQELSVVSLH
jgi:hypothetical protein